MHCFCHESGGRFEPGFASTLYKPRLRDLGPFPRPLGLAANEEAEDVPASIDSQGTSPLDELAQLDSDIKLIFSPQGLAKLLQSINPNARLSARLHHLSAFVQRSEPALPGLQFFRIADLPTELLLRVLEELDMSSLRRFSRLSRWARAASAPILFSTLKLWGRATQEQFMWFYTRDENPPVPSLESKCEEALATLPEHFFGFVRRACFAFRPDAPAAGNDAGQGEEAKMDDDDEAWETDDEQEMADAESGDDDRMAVGRDDQMAGGERHDSHEDVNVDPVGLTASHTALDAILAKLVAVTEIKVCLEGNIPAATLHVFAKLSVLPKTAGLSIHATQVGLGQLLADLRAVGLDHRRRLAVESSLDLSPLDGLRYLRELRELDHLDLTWNNYHPFQPQNAVNQSMWPPAPLLEHWPTQLRALSVSLAQPTSPGDLLELLFRSAPTLQRLRLVGVDVRGYGGTPGLARGRDAAFPVLQSVMLGHMIGVAEDGILVFLSELLDIFSRGPIVARLQIDTSSFNTPEPLPAGPPQTWHIRNRTGGSAEA